MSQSSKGTLRREPGETEWRNTKVSPVRGDGDPACEMGDDVIAYRHGGGVVAEDARLRCVGNVLGIAMQLDHAAVGEDGENLG